MSRNVRVGVLGAAGFTGGELCRLLLNHPRVSEIIPAGRETGMLGRAHQNLMGCDLKIVKIEELLEAADALDFVFACLPEGGAIPAIEQCLKRGVRVIDLSANFRFQDPELFTEAHGKLHGAPYLLPDAVYGLPEFARDRIRSARLIANPGCYVTAFLLAVAPLFAPDKPALVDSESVVFINAVNGTTGTGRHQENVHHAIVANDMLPYNMSGHRHYFEIKDQLNRLFGKQVKMDLNTAHAPVPRGIYMQLSIKAANPASVTRSSILDVYKSYYGQGHAGEFFVLINDNERLLGTSKEYDIYPSMTRVAGSNYCHIGADFNANTGYMKIISVIDNIVKGAAGQAIQNMNLMMGIDETTGLKTYGL